MEYPNEEMQALSEYVCLKMHPNELRAKYVEHIRIEYCAEELILLLQALSKGLTAILYGLIASYLFEKFKSESQHEEYRDIERLIREQESLIIRVEERIESGGTSSEESRKIIQLHRDVLRRIRNEDRELYDLITRGYEELDEVGVRELTEWIDFHFWERPNSK